MEEGNAFYVVRKGNIIATYRTLSECHAQVSSSVCDPAVSVYKGYCLSEETEEYLASRGLKNALYSIDAADVKEDLFSNLVPCCFQDVIGASSFLTECPKQHLVLGDPVVAQPISFKPDVVGSISTSVECSKQLSDQGNSFDVQPISPKHMLCILKFDGASKGNPGKAGAGAVLRTEDGRVIARLRQGLGIVTNNVAEYRAVILGMKYAIKKGFKRIHVRGDSQLVCMQVQGLWQTKHQNMIELCKEVKKLKENFLSFQISHVKREFNSDADAQANLAIDLSNAEIYEESAEGF